MRRQAGFFDVDDRLKRLSDLGDQLTATHAAAHDGARLEEVLDRANTASGVWADTAYRSAKNEGILARRGFVSRIHRKKPKGKPVPEQTRHANAQKSKVRSAIEHVFAHQKGLMGLFVRTIGLARARLKIGFTPTTCVVSFSADATRARLTASAGQTGRSIAINRHCQSTTSPLSCSTRP
jgi:IS5 family transposase